MNDYEHGYAVALVKLGLAAYRDPKRSGLAPEEIDLLQHERATRALGRGQTLRGINEGGGVMTSKSRAKITQKMVPQFHATTQRLREGGHTWVPSYQQAGGLSGKEITQRFRDAAPTENVKKLVGLEAPKFDVSQDIAAKIKRKGMSQELAYLRGRGVQFQPTDFKTVAQKLRAGLQAVR